MLTNEQVKELYELRVRHRELRRTQDYLERRFETITGLDEHESLHYLANADLCSDFKWKQAIVAEIKSLRGSSDG